MSIARIPMACSFPRPPIRRRPPCFQGAVLDQLSGEVYRLERMAAGGTGGDHDKGYVSRPDQQNTSKEPEGAVRGKENGNEDDAEGSPMRAVGQEPEGWGVDPLEQVQNLANDAGGSLEHDPGRLRASASASNQPYTRGDPLDDDKTTGPALPGAAISEQRLSLPEQEALQRPLPKSPAGNGKAEKEEPAAVEIARLSSELREASGLAEKYRGELRAARQM